MTIPEIKVLLDEAGVDYDPRARKDELEALLAATENPNGAPPAAPLDKVPATEAPPPEPKDDQMDAGEPEATPLPAAPEGYVYVRREPYKRHDPETGKPTGETVDYRLVTEEAYEERVDLELYE